MNGEVTISSSTNDSLFNNVFWNGVNWQYVGNGMSVYGYRKWATNQWEMRTWPDGTAGNNAGNGSQVFGFASLTGNVGIGTIPTVAKLDVNQVSAGSIALQGANNGTAFWKILNPVGGAGTGWNAANAVQYVGKDNGTNRSINAAGTVNASSADFAEWIDWSGPKPEMGSVVLYRGSYVVVSSPMTAAFVGNDVKNPEHSILIAFAGQLPVLVKGVVREGDLIVAGDDGSARAISRSIASTNDAMKAVGTAWSSSDDPGLKRIHVAVGIGLGAGHADVVKLRKENEELRARLDRIEKFLETKSNSR